MLHGLGIETGIDLDKLVDTGVWISSFLKREPGSKAGRAIAAKRASRMNSPCIKVCVMDDDDRYCLGCKRTLDEIARWGEMSDAERASVMAKLSLRRAENPSSSPTEAAS